MRARLALVAVLLLPSAFAAEDAASALGRLPRPYEDMAAASDGHDAYFFGGTDCARLDGTCVLSDAVHRVAANGTVTLATTLPSPRRGAAAAWDGAAFLVVGGITADGGSDEVVRVDPDEGTTSVVARLPSPLAYAGVAWTEAGLVVAGGATPEGFSDAVLVVVGSRVDEVARLPSARAGLAAASDGMRTFLVGGHDGNTTLGDVLVVEGDAVRHLAEVPARAGAAAVWAGGALHVLGGSATEDATDVLRIDPATGQVLPLPARLPAPVRTAAAASVDGAFVVAGSGTQVLRVPVPVPVAGAPIAPRLPGPRAGAAAVLDGDRLVLVGGVGPAGGLADVVAVDLATFVTTPLARLPTPLERPSAWTVDGDIHVAGGLDGQRPADGAWRIAFRDGTVTPLPARPLLGPGDVAAAEGAHVRVVTGSDDRARVATWDPRAGAEVGTAVELPGTVWYPATASVGGAFVVAGVDVGGHDLRGVHRIDASGATEVARLPEARSGASAVAFDGDVLLVGGRTAEGWALEVLRIDLARGEVVPTGAALPEGRAFAAAVAHEGRVVVVGGEGPDGATADVLVLDVPERPSRPTPAPHAPPATLEDERPAPAGGPLGALAALAAVAVLARR